MPAKFQSPPIIPKKIPNASFFNIYFI